MLRPRLAPLALALLTTLTACPAPSTVQPATSIIGSDPFPLLALPIAITSPNVTQANDPAEFTAAAPENAAAVNLEWAFGDGSTSTDPNPTHAYATPGTYAVTVTGDADGTPVQGEARVHVLPRLERVSSVLERAGLSGTDTLTLDLGALPDGFTARWDFGDGTTGTGARVTHAYPTLGTYPLKLRITDDRLTAQTARVQALAALEGPTAYTDESWVTRWEPKPRARFTLNGPNGAGNPFGIAPLEVSFDASTSHGSSTLRYAWDFGDSTTGTGPKVKHTFNEGERVVKLTVTDSKGQTDAYRAYVVAKNKLSLTQLAFQYPDTTAPATLNAAGFTADASSLHLGPNEITAPTTAASARLTPQSALAWTDHYPWVLHESARVIGAVTTWTPWTTSTPNVFTPCARVEAYYNGALILNQILTTHPLDRTLCSRVRVSGSTYPPLEARADSEHRVSSSFVDQSYQFDTFAGLRVPRVIVAVLADRLVPGEQPSPFITLNTLPSSSGGSEMILTARVRESDLNDRAVTIPVPVYAVDRAGALETNATGYFNASIQGFTTDCGDCVMVRGEARVNVRVPVAQFTSSSSSIDVTRVRVYANPTCGADNTVFATPNVRAVLNGCATITATSEAPSGVQGLEPFKYAPANPARILFDRVITGETADAIANFNEYMNHGLWEDTKDFVIHLLPFVGSGKDFLDAVTACVKDGCNPLALILAGGGVVVDAAPVVGKAFAPFFKVVKASRLAEKGIARGLEEVTVAALEARKDFPGIRDDLESAFGRSARELEACGRACIQDADRFVQRFSTSTGGAPQATQKLDDLLAEARSKSVSAREHLETLEEFSQCAVAAAGTDGTIRPQALPGRCDFQELLRWRELAFDPAKRKWIADEANAAIRYEQQYAKRVVRDPTGDFDFIEGTLLLDVKGADGRLAQHFNYDSFTRSIAKELTASSADLILVDMHWIPTSDVHAVENFVRALDTMSVSKIRLIR